jgi:hypothetical protein
LSAAGPGTYFTITRARADNSRSVAAITSPTPAADAHLLERALDSSSLRRQATALAPVLRGPFLSAARRLVPPGTTVIVEPKTFRSLGNAAVVHAETSGGQTYILRLVRQHKTWLILYTEASQ